MPSDQPETSRKVTFSHVIQAGLARGLIAIVRMFPVEVASAFGAWIGRTIGPLLPISRMATRNIERAFPEKTRNEVDVIVRGMWDNFGRVVFEFPNLHKIRFSGSNPHVQLVNVEEVIRARDDGKPGLFVSGHIGNWFRGE